MNRDGLDKLKFLYKYISFLYKKKLKLNLEREFFLSYNNSDIRRGFTKIRFRDHNLEIERTILQNT